MSKIQIFVEGIDDKKFIDDYLKYLKIDTINVSTNEIQGWTNLHLAKNLFNENSNKGGINLIIFDADDDCECRRKEILDKGQQLEIEFKLFLFPTNRDTGNLENLLISISNPNHCSIFQCFETYKRCLSEQNKQYTIPDNKTKIYTYIETLGQEAKTEKRNYLDAELWNLNHENLQNLRAFIIESCPII